VTIGMFLCSFGSGSWLFECGWLELLAVKIIAGIMIAFQGWISYTLISRVGVEDKMLQKEFGSKWDEWAKNVPYRLIPGII
jgi:protein-S-isoprenylcysteine O-methyltransferase Ste14